VGRVPRLHRYYGRLRLLVTLPAMLLRASFPSPGGTSCARLVRVPPGVGWGSCALDARLAQASGLLFGEPDGPSLTRRSTRPPRFLGRLSERALLFDPGGASAPMIVERLGAAFCWVNGIGLRDHLLSGLHHTAHSLAVYASQAPSRTTTQDSLPAGDQPLPGGSNYPARRLRRFPRRSSAHRFLLLQASLAH
jgi:hypothetical protein